jgi:hypothetical protein
MNLATLCIPVSSPVTVEKRKVITAAQPSTPSSKVSFPATLGKATIPVAMTVDIAG